MRLQLNSRSITLMESVKSDGSKMEMQRLIVSCVSDKFKRGVRMVISGEAMGNVQIASGRKESVGGGGGGGGGGRRSKYARVRDVSDSFIKCRTNASRVATHLPLQLSPFSCTTRSFVRLCFALEFLLSASPSTYFPLLFFRFFCIKDFPFSADCFPTLALAQEVLRLRKHAPEVQ